MTLYRLSFFEIEEKDKGDEFWSKDLVKGKGENRINIKDEEYDINPTIQARFTNTKLTTKHMDDEETLTVFNFPRKCCILLFDTY